MVVVTQTSNNRAVKAGAESLYWIVTLTTHKSSDNRWTTELQSEAERFAKAKTGTI